jgi:hypothetical protein
MRERRVEKKGDYQMARRERGRTCRNKQVSLYAKESKFLRLILLISIEFQNIDDNQGSLPKKKFFPFEYYNLIIREVTSTKIVSTNY